MADPVRRKDMDAILRDYAPDVVMFDVPPPLLCEGIEAYRATWSLFFEASLWKRQDADATGPYLSCGDQAR